jgi:hypothetical protein
MSGCLRWEFAARDTDPRSDGSTRYRHAVVPDTAEIDDGPTPWGALVWLLPPAAVLLSVMDVGDLAYLVRTGNVMVRDGHVLRQDIFTFTVWGDAWVNQQWGAALVFALVHRIAGWAGLVFLRAALISLSVGGSYLRARRASADAIVAAGVTLACLLVAITLPGALALRSQLLALPLFVGASAILDAHRARPHLTYWLIPIGVAWANLHGSFLLLPLLVALAIVGDVLDRVRVRQLAAIGVATLLTPLATPWGVDVYGYVLNLGVNPTVRNVVDEWLPLVRQPIAAATFVAVNGLLIWLVTRRASRVRIDLVIGLVIFGALALWIGRNVLWWAAYAGPAYAALLAGWRPGSAWARRATIALTAMLVTLLALGGLHVVTADPPERLLADAPVQVATAIRSLDHARVFAARGASWLELEAPDARYFVDSRVELFPDRIWAEYFDVLHAAPHWEDVLDRWEVDTIVVTPDRQPDLFAAIRSSTAWAERLRDPEGWVFVRSAPE